MEKAYFKNIRNEIIPLLNQAKEEVVIAMAWFTSNELFQAILDCRKRNVEVEVVILDNATNFMYYAPDFNLLIKERGILKIAPLSYGFMHHKFCVIDNRIVITGSYNWTYYAETRNIENIVISDNLDVVLQYKEEFRTLSSDLLEATESPRLSWDEIESCHDINFDELNYEIDNIAKARNLPERKVVKSTTSVTIEEKPLNPISKYDIGIKTTTKGDNCSMTPIIKSGTRLPCMSKTLKTYNYSDHRDNILLTVLYDKKGEKKLLTEKAIKEITANRSDWELTITVQFNLLQNGDLLAEIRCEETGKLLRVTASNPDFVDYEE